MSSHIILKQIITVSPQVEKWKETQMKLFLQLGSYLFHQNWSEEEKKINQEQQQESSWTFNPGLDELNFSLLVWLFETSTALKVNQNWIQEIDFFWTNPTVLSTIASTHQKKIQFIKGIFFSSDFDMEYEENYGPDLLNDLFCPEREYSFQLVTKDERSIHPSIAERVHLSEISHVCIRRIKTFIFQNMWLYRCIVARSYSGTKHECVKKGKTTFHIELEILSNAINESKGTINFTAEICEKGIDLLGRYQIPYSLIHLNHEVYFHKFLSKNEEDEACNEKQEQIVPLNYFQFLL